MVVGIDANLDNLDFSFLSSARAFALIVVIVKLQYRGDQNATLRKLQDLL